MTSGSKKKSPASRPAARAKAAAIPDSDLNPHVRDAMARLQDEVQQLRSQLLAANQRVRILESLADHDVLLPILNRRAFVRELRRIAAFNERHGLTGSVLFFDLDNFKQINDRHGHAAGDAALRHVADVLQGAVRTSDVVGRLGGDEFGVILAHADQSAAAQKAEDLAQAVRKTPVDVDSLTFSVKVSCGAHTMQAGEPIEEMLQAADEAMYAQKRASA